MILVVCMIQMLVGILYVPTDKVPIPGLSLLQSQHMSFY